MMAKRIAYILFKGKKLYNLFDNSFFSFTYSPNELYSTKYNIII